MSKKKANNSLIFQFEEVIDSLLGKNGNDFITMVEVYEEFKRRHPDNSGELIPKKGQKDPFKEKYAGVARSAKNKLNETLKETCSQSFITQKKGRIVSFKYPNNMVKNPMEHIKAHLKTLRLESFLDLINISKGILPDELLANFLMRAENEADSERSIIIEFDSNDRLKNFNLLPTLYQSIKNRKVISFSYQPFGKDSSNVILHPHYLKEYNSRWFLFGQIDRQDDYPLYALDRIQMPIKTVDEIPYVPSHIKYETYFDDIVGVTHLKRETTKHIVIKTFDKYVHNRILTKPLHKSQKEELQFGNHDKEIYGLISIDVIPNYELLGLLFSFESHIKVMGPIDFMNSFAKEVEEMNKLYDNI